MKKVWLFSIGAMILAVAAGCRPELAPAELSPKEQRWAEIFQENYASWEVPQTQPFSLRYSDEYTEQELAELQARNNPTPDVSPLDGAVIGETIEFDDGDVMDAIDETVIDASPVVPAEVAAAPVVETVTYKVVKGDSLSKIAQKFYGNGNKYPQILDANKELLKGNPNRLRVGQELVIPNPIKK